MFSLLTRRPLFKPMASTEHNASEVDVLLYQMISFCGESFKQDFLQRCSRSMDYFWLDCASLFYSRSSFFWLIINNTAYDQVGSRNSRALIANRSRNVFSILDVHWILKTWQAQRTSWRNACALIQRIVQPLGSFSFTLGWCCRFVYIFHPQYAVRWEECRESIALKNIG